MKMIKECFNHNSSCILSNHKTNLYKRNKLTKRLNIGQKSILLFIVHKKYFEINYIFFIFLLFLSFCTSSRPTPNLDEEFSRKSYCYYNKYIVLDTSSKKNNSIHIINESQEGWIENTTSNLEIIFNNIHNIQTLYNEHPECKEKIIYQIENEKLLMINMLKLYHRILERELLNYLKIHKNFNNNKIVGDFMETKKAIIESINYLYDNINKYIFKNNKNEILTEKIEFDIKYWHQTYYILTFELFFQLPKEFKKEWFKKFKL